MLNGQRRRRRACVPERKKKMTSAYHSPYANARFHLALKRDVYGVNTNHVCTDDCARASDAVDDPIFQSTTLVLDPVDSVHVCVVNGVVHQCRSDVTATHPYYSDSTRRCCVSARELAPEMDPSHWADELEQMAESEGISSAQQASLREFRERSAMGRGIADYDRNGELRRKRRKVDDRTCIEYQDPDFATKDNNPYRTTDAFFAPTEADMSMRRFLHGDVEEETIVLTKDTEKTNKKPAARVALRNKRKLIKTRRARPATQIGPSHKDLVDRFDITKLAAACGTTMAAPPPSPVVVVSTPIPIAVAPETIPATTRAFWYKNVDPFLPLVDTNLQSYSSKMQYSSVEEKVRARATNTCMADYFWETFMTDWCHSMCDAAVEDAIGCYFQAARAYGAALRTDYARVQNTNMDGGAACLDTQMAALDSRRDGGDWRAPATTTTTTTRIEPLRLLGIPSRRRLVELLERERRLVLQYHASDYMSVVRAPGTTKTPSAPFALFAMTLAVLGEVDTRDQSASKRGDLSDIVAALCEGIDIAYTDKTNAFTLLTFLERSGWLVRVQNQHHAARASLSDKGRMLLRALVGLASRHLFTHHGNTYIHPMALYNAFSAVM